MAEDQDPNTDPTTDPDDSGQEEEWTPPTKEEWEKAQRTAAVRKAERDAARREAAALKEAQGKDKPKADDPAAQVAEARAQAREESDTRARRSAGITALVEAGLTRAAAKEALPLLKLKGLDVDADGDVDEEELEERVAALKAKFPGMFPGKGKAPKQRTADGAGTARITKNGTQRTNDALMRQAGYRD